MLTPKVELILSHQLNTALYSKCLVENEAPLYATALYLNTMAQNWAAIVVDDYQTVFPFCFKIKYGIRYAYMPSFVQQLGIFGNADVVIVNAILTRLKQFVKFGDLMIASHPKVTIPNNCILIPKTNYVLHLNNKYDYISQNYSTNLRRHIKRALSNNLQYLKTNDINEALDCYYKLYSSRMPQTTLLDFSNFKSLCKTLQPNNCFIRKIVNNNNELLTISLFLKNHQTIYNLANSTTSSGRAVSSNYLLYAKVFEEFASSNLYFDFEGSDLPGVKEFYKQFNPINQKYYHWHFNYLPLLLKLFKR